MVRVRASACVHSQAYATAVVASSDIMSRSTMEPLRPPRSDSRDGRQSPEYCRDNLFRHCYGQVLRPSRMRRRYATRTLLLLAPEAAPDEDSHPPLSHP